MANPIVNGIKDPSRIVRVAVSAAVLQGDFVVVLPWCGIATHEVTAADITAGAAGSGLAYLDLDVSEQEIDATAASAMFTAIGNKVWLSSAPAFAASGAPGSYLVGYCTIPSVAASPYSFRFKNIGEAIAFADVDSVALSGIPFRKTVKIVSTAAGTAVPIIPAASVPGTSKIFVTDMLAVVSDSTAWATTGTIVKIQDTAGTPVVGVTMAVAALTANAKLNLCTANVTLGDAVKKGTGFTVAKGLNLVGDADFGAGSDLYVTVCGFIAVA